MDLSLCILNSIEEAKDFLRRQAGKAESWRIIATHNAVKDFLSENGVESIHISGCAPQNGLRSAFHEASQQTASLLRRLDKIAAGKISETLGLPEMSYFYPLYVYLGTYEWLTLRRLKEACENLFRDHAYDHVLVYQPASTGFLNAVSLAGVIAPHSPGSVVFHQSVAARTQNLIGQTIRLSRRVKAKPTDAFKRVWMRSFARAVTLEAGKPGIIILLEPLYDLSFLVDRLDPSSVLLWPEEGVPRIRGLDSAAVRSRLAALPEVLKLLDADGIAEGLDPCFRQLVEKIVDDFAKHATTYLLPLLYLKLVQSRSDLRLAIWGNPPAWGPRSLMVEYFLRRNLPVLGMQHGGSYAVQDCSSVHFDSDFSRCTHYLSYGFDEDDLRKTYPERAAACEILPVGSTRLNRGNVAIGAVTKKTIDILFPLTIDLSFFVQGFRVPAHLLYTYQTALIRFLDTMEDLNVVIKPIPYHDQTTCGVLSLLKNMKHARLVSDMTIQECLREFRIRACVIEYPSTPLYEVLGEDMEIFLLSDPVLPFAAEPLALLQKRVHYFETVAAAIAVIRAWAKGDLPEKRDTAFLEKYVVKPNTHVQILDVIHSLVGPPLSVEKVSNS